MRAISRRPTKKQIKDVHRKVRDTYNNDEEKQKQWKQIRQRDHLDEAYGTDTHHKNSSIGKRAAHHILNGNALKQQLTKHTPTDHPSIIPDDCDFSFSFIKEVKPDGTKVFDGVDLSEYQLLVEFNLSQCFENVDQMKNIFDDKLFSSKLMIKYDETTYDFWVKSIAKSGSAFARFFGIEVTSCIMRYRWGICIPIGDGMMVLCGKHYNILVGAGFCNLEQTKKQIESHKMIHFEVETMEKVEIEFYCKKGNDKSIDDVFVSVMTYKFRRNQLQPTRQTPLVLFDGAEYAQRSVNDNINPVLYPPYDAYNEQNIFQYQGAFDECSFHSPDMVFPSMRDSDLMPLINDDEKSYVQDRYHNRRFQDLNGFGDLRNGLHRRTLTDRRSERRPRTVFNSANMDNGGVL